MNADFDARFDEIVAAAVAAWVKSGLEEKFWGEAKGWAQDAATNAYTEDCSDEEWLADTLQRIGIAG